MFLLYAKINHWQGFQVSTTLMKNERENNINNVLYWQVTQLKYFLNAAPRRAPTQLMELQSKMDMPQKKEKPKLSKPAY